ncbi:hypothetical protein LTR78_002358 [Recurvomyces mirabilis]|uniref:Uncharacterized protein n=1 Tax=Recurvomyces mirabilis TaxID=574656 RepID=A0AAE0WTH6_9PEZI|nr:hypothetical protein LTR78_002358 [Recurvomyces mirabilis]KAK5157287.1 hypothetical protein LTS14_004052 [Recurvomyces mirabilis]
MAFSYSLLLLTCVNLAFAALYGNDTISAVNATHITNTTISSSSSSANTSTSSLTPSLSTSHSESSSLTLTLATSAPGGSSFTGLPRPDLPSVNSSATVQHSSSSQNASVLRTAFLTAEVAGNATAFQSSLVSAQSSGQSLSSTLRGLGNTTASLHNSSSITGASTRSASSGSPAYINSTATKASNASLPAISSGSAYASQCNAKLIGWSSSSQSAPVVSYSTISTWTYTNWSAVITTLAGCDTHARLDGSYTPIASASTTVAYMDYTQTGILAKPSCSINPSDCENLSVASSAYSSSYNAALTQGQLTLILASQATAFTIQDNTTTIVTTYGSTAMTPPPVITFQGKAYTGSAYSRYDNAGSDTVYRISAIAQPLFQTNLKDGSSVVSNRDFGFPYRDIPKPQCTRAANGTGCGACTIHGGEVQLLYFPVPTTASRNMCATKIGAPTTCPLGPTTAPYVPGSIYAPPGMARGICTNYINCPYLLGNATKTTDSGPFTVSAGTTLYQNRAYISLQTAYAMNSCGYVGGKHTGALLTLASTQVYSIGNELGACVDDGHLFNFADLLPNLPQSAFSAVLFGGGDSCAHPNGVPWPDSFNGDFMNGVPLEGDPCYDTIADYAYRPTLVVPTQIRQLDPAWATCAVALEGLYDPPKALTPQAAVATPIVSSVATPTSASPASGQVTPGPTQTADPVVSKATTQPSPASSVDPGDPTASASQTASNAPEGPSAVASSAGSAAQGVSASGSGGSSADLGAAGSILSQALATSSNNVGAGVGGAVASVIGATKIISNADPSDPGSTNGAGSDPKSNNGGNTAIVEVGSSSFSVIATIQASGSSAVIIVGGGTTVTLSPGQTSSIAEVTVSAGSNGGAVVGTGAAAATVGVSTNQGAGGSLAVVQSAAGANNGAILTIGSNTLTAIATTFTVLDGKVTAAAVLAGSTLLQGGAPATIDGQAVSLESAGLVVGSSTTLKLSPLPSASAIITGAAVTLGSTTLTASERVVEGADGQLTTEAVIAGTTLQLNGATSSVSGHILSLGAKGIVVDGSTAGLSALPAPTPATISGALVTLGSSIQTASETVVTGSNGQLTTLAVLDGTTLRSGGPPFTISGHVVSLGAQGIVVDGTQTDHISELPVCVTGNALATFTEHGQVFTATSISGRLGWYIVDGQTVSVGGLPVTVDGLSLTAQASGLIIDGTQTVSSFTSNSGSPAHLTAAKGPLMTSSSQRGQVTGEATATSTRKSAAPSDRRWDGSSATWLTTALICFLAWRS